MRNGILGHITLLCCLLPVFLTACQEEEQISKGKGRLILEDIGISIDAETRAFSLPPLNVSDIIIDIIDPLGAVIETGNIDHYAKGVDLFAATYTIKAYYGTKAQMNKTPYYEKSETVAIAENETKSITLTVGLANGIIIPNIPDDLIGNYNSVPVFYVSYGEEKIAVANGEALYVMPAENPYVLTLEGQNKANVNIVKSIGNLNVVAQKVYNINCQLTLPKLILPEQQNGAWAKRLYITPVVTKDAQDNVIPTPKGIVYEIQENNKEGETDNWTEWKTVTTSQITTDKEGTLEYITGLLPNKEYRIQAKLGDIISNEIKFRTEEENIPNDCNMNSWDTENTRKLSSKNYSSYRPHSGQWATTNTKTFNQGGTFICNAYPSVTYEGKDNGNAAVIRSIGWTGGITNTSSICYQYSAGRLFLGTYSYNDYKDTYNYGIDFSSRPTKIKFQCKYESCNNDKFKVWVIVENRENNKVTQLAYGEKIEGTISSYNEQSIELAYSDHYTKPTHFYIVFSSSYLCNDTFDNEKNAMKNAKVITYHDKYWGGSTLYIDDIELIYE